MIYYNHQREMLPEIKIYSHKAEGHSANQKGKENDKNRVSKEDLQ